MSNFGKLRRYLSLPSRNAARIERDVDEELRSHLAMRAESLEREGASPDEARAQALQKFGDLDDAARYCAAVDRDSERRRRTTGWLSEILQDARHTLRMMRRAPAFAAATILTLAIAVGATTTVFAAVYTYLIRPLPFPEAGRLVSIVDRPTLDRFPRMPSTEGVDWRVVDPLFDATALWDLDGFTIRGEQYAENVTGAWGSPGYFKALSVRVALGRGFRPDEYRAPAPVAIVSHDLWVRRFAGDSGAIGSVVAMYSTDRPNAATLVTIVGVLPRDFWPIHWRESDVLRPLPAENWMPPLARLKPGASLAETQRRLDAVVRAQIRGAIDPAWHMSLFSPLAQHSERVRPLLVATFGAALFMLLAACGSVAGTLVSRMAARRAELSIRLALGGSRSRIVRQLLTESAVLATLAGALGLAFAYVLLAASGPVIERRLGITVPGGAVALRPTTSIMALAALASALTGIALGLVPALTFFRLDRKSGAAPLFSVGRSVSSRGGGARIRRVLIATQVALAMVLAFGAGLMLKTVARMADTDLGFRPDGVLKGTMLLPTARYPDSAAKRQVVRRVLERVAETSSVRNVAAVFPPPFGWGWRLPVTAVDGYTIDKESPPSAMVFTVSPAYFETMDIRLRSGRLLRDSDDHASPLVVVISDGLARRLSVDGNVVGRRIRVRVPHNASFDDDDRLPWRTVVGIVSDTKKEFTTDPFPDVYVPYSQNPRALVAIVVRTDSPERTVFEPVRRAVASVDPGLALYDVEAINDVIANEGGQRRGLTVLLGTFAAFALGLSALALYASLAYSVVQRRSELAVRMAIGASARSILRLVVAEGVVTAAIGVALGAAASLALGRVLAAQVYGVGTNDPVTLASIAVVLVAAVIGACVVPGLRAVRTDPALALRE
jgi:putative ABC transport system permease protein